MNRSAHECAGSTIVLGLFFSLTFSILSSSAVAAGSTPVEDARTDLARRLQVTLNEVMVVEQTEETWPDSSLGCPRPGMVYRQVLTNGSRLVLDVAGRHYNYHAGTSGKYFYCKPTKKGPVGPLGIKAKS